MPLLWLSTLSTLAVEGPNPADSGGPAAVPPSWVDGNLWPWIQYHWS